MTLADLGDALKSVLPQTYHYGAPIKTSAPYIVWAEDGQADAEWADNKMRVQVLSGTVDYFTRTEYDANFANIQAALGGLPLSWRLASVQFEDDTQLIHYEWTWEGVFSRGQD